MIVNFIIYTRPHFLFLEGVPCPIVILRAQSAKKGPNCLTISHLSK